MNYLYKLTLALILFTQSLTATAEVKKVTLQLSWFHQFQFAGYYIAKEKGFYKKLGMDVEIKPFQFGIDIPKEVSENKIDFSIGRETLILERSKNKNIVALYALFQTSPLVLLSTKESYINSISDFKGKRIMTTIDDSSEVSLKAMISSSKVNLNDLEFLKHTHNIKDLITKKTDVISAYISKAPFSLQKIGIDYSLFDPKEYGFDMYSDFLYTSEFLISNDVNTVRNFKEASLLGWEYAYSNIEESVDLILKKYNTQNLSKEELIFEAKELKKLSFDNSNALGNIEKNKLKRIVDLYNVMGLLDNKIDLDKFIYNENISNFKFTDKEKEYLKNKKNITMCINPEWMPYDKLDKNGNHVGIIADYFEIFQKNIDIPIQVIKTKTWSQSIDFAKNRKCDILSLAGKTKEKQKYLNFTTTYFDTSYVLATKTDITFINNLKNLKNLKIGVLKGSSFNEILQNNYPFISIINVKNIEEGLEKVAKGELFGFIDSFATVRYLLETKFFGELKVSGKFEEHLSLGIAIRNDEPILLDIFNSIIQKLTVEIKEKILTKYITIKYEKGIDYDLIIKIITAFIILICIFIFFLRKLYRLKNKINKLNMTLKFKIKEEIKLSKEKDVTIYKQAKLISMGEMINNIAHQWRQPLFEVNSVIMSLESDFYNNRMNKQSLETNLNKIEKLTEYMSTTIDNFQDFFNNDKVKIKFLISTNIKKVLNLFENSFKKANIKINLNIYKDVMIEAYEGEMLQVLIILLQNAKDAFIENKVQNPLINLDVNIVKNKLVISIEDNAGGIKSEIINKIFEPYFTTKIHGQGIGLGLYLSKQILEKSICGTLDVKSSGHMSKFTITVPL